MNQFYRQYGKRFVDMAIAGLLLLALSPVLILIALSIRLKLGAPVLFKQLRPGLKGKLFTLHKFRTMTSARDAAGNLLSDADRLPKFGKLLRSTSFDELPELWDVLMGRMSLVGPRPLLEQYLPLYTEYQKQRHNVRPGLTGLAQVNGRNGISWEERFNYDVRYVERCSFVLDLRILAKTIACVVQQDGINAEEHATCPLFEGSANRSNDDSNRAA